MEREIAANKFQESESRLNDYLKDHPDSSKAHYDLGYIEFRTHNMGSSIKELAKSLELNPANAEAHKILALDCSIIGRYDLAETELIEAARLKPESAEIHYFLARTYYTAASILSPNPNFKLPFAWIPPRSRPTAIWELPWKLWRRHRSA